ncbi:hypothetical protein [Paraburkholderia susongensis]|uniref:hypothetical protein n=1 Tax=Paraburkholderia susongensis TaxID=1515439 RepID=UPI00117E852F|nr:hypothetical protein [Paraburkholderia susongensis]
MLGCHRRWTEISEVSCGCAVGHARLAAGIKRERISFVFANHRKFAEGSQERNLICIEIRINLSTHDAWRATCRIGGKAHAQRKRSGVAGACFEGADPAVEGAILLDFARQKTLPLVWLHAHRIASAITDGHRLSLDVIAASLLDYRVMLSKDKSLC